MPVQRLSIRLIATLAIFTAILFVTSTRAAAQEQVLHSFTNNGTDGIDPDGGADLRCRRQSLRHDFRGWHLQRAARCSS